MNGSSPSPWPAIIKIALLIGCTMVFCVLGLVSGVLAAKIMQHAGGARSDELLVTVLVPPVVGALFGFFVGLVSTLYVRRAPEPAPGHGPFQPLPQPPVAAATHLEPPPRV
jgi:hypothetical protein